MGQRASNTATVTFNDVEVPAENMIGEENKGFKLAMGKDIDSALQIFHSERFVLVDAEGRIRGYYEADKPGIDSLLRDVHFLINVR